MTALGIDTSNYTTSAARYDGISVTDNRRKLLPVPKGRKQTMANTLTYANIYITLQGKNQ